MIYPILCQGQDLPPTMYSVCESLANYNATDTTKIKDMWKIARRTLFDFNYILTANVDKATFEQNIINHYIMRRINYPTVTLFKIMLENKLNEILPKYNMLWDSQINWNIFKGGISERHLEDVTESTNTGNTTDNVTQTGESNDIGTNTNKINTENITNTIASNSMSDTPQNNIEDVKNGTYVTEFNYNVGDTTGNNTTDSTTNTTNKNNTTNTTNSKSNTESNGNIKKNVGEKIERTNDNQLELLLKYEQEYNNIWTMLYKDLDCLFYGLL